MNEEYAKRVVKELKNLGYGARIEKDAEIDYWIARVYLGQDMNFEEF